jgi:hypothetical protein
LEFPTTLTLEGAISMTIYYTAIDRTPFTYVITHIPTGKKYYGVRYKKGCLPSDLWSTYFTSSKIIHALINQDGKEAFSFEIRKTFSSVKHCLIWETTVLHRLNARDNAQWLNNHNGGNTFYNNTPASIETREKMSKVRKGKPKSETMKYNAMWYYKLSFDDGNVEFIKGSANVLKRLNKKNWDHIIGSMKNKGGYLPRSKVTIHRMNKDFVLTS